MSGSISEMRDYYRERAAEYDEVYEKPERQHDISQLRADLPGLVEGCRVFEVAAGTGFWTQPLSTTARSIVATDINDETLAIARSRSYSCPVSFELADAYALGPEPGEPFDAAFVGFWWSHVPLGMIPAFLESLHGHVGPGCEVIVVDNRYVEGSNHPVTRVDDDGNVYQARQLNTGARYEVIKNFPTESELRGLLDGRAESIELLEYEYFWRLRYRVAA